MRHHLAFRALVRLALVLTFVVNLAAPAFSQERQSADKQNADKQKADKQKSGKLRRADFERLVVVGDSLSAGFQNNSLLDSQQQFSYPNLVAEQAGATLTQPLIAYPGIPNVLQLISPGPPPLIVPAPGISSGRTNPGVQVRNLAVPGARVQDALTTRPNPADGINTLTDIILGLPAFIPGVGDGVARSQVEFAETLQPKVVFLWLGNNDALGAALAANPALLTPLADFERAYREVATRIRATGARVVAANITDVTVVPFLTSAEEVAARVGLPLDLLTPRLGIRSGDFVTPAAFSLIPGILGGAPGPLPANTVLTAAEAAVIRARVNAFNSFIADQARLNGFALADVNGLLNFVDRFGYPVLLSDPFELRFLSTDFLGGVFSLDGVHPTRTGYAVIANEFIRQLDLRFDARLNPVNVWRIADDDPLVLRGSIGSNNLRNTFGVPQDMNANEVFGAPR